MNCELYNIWSKKWANWGAGRDKKKRNEWEKKIFSTFDRGFNFALKVVAKSTDTIGNKIKMLRTKEKRMNKRRY